MAGPTKELLALVIGACLAWRLTLLRWMADNWPARRTRWGILPDKATSNGKIDGIVVRVMARSGDAAMPSRPR
jgi:hypothetical protein